MDTRLDRHDAMTDSAGSLFAALPNTPLPDEVATVLVRGTGVRIERILSTGQTSPPGFWYDQDEHEWVAVLSGQASLRFQDESEPRHLNPGDWLFIPAHRRHRVDRTTSPTVWLAVFFT